MKKLIPFLILFITLSIMTESCKPKPACGNTKKAVKKKTKTLKQNSHFQM